MPSPKSGTVVEDLKAAIVEVKGGGSMEYRAEGSGEVSVTIGDTSFPPAKVLDNMKAFYGHLLRSRTNAPKGGGAGSSSMLGNNTSSMPGNKEGTPMIPEVANEKKKKSGRARNYFLEAALQTSSGPTILLNPDTVLPTSVGYFR